MRLDINIIKENKKNAITIKEIKAIFLLVWEHIKIGNYNGIINFNIIFKDDIQKINKNYRGIDKDTNVLTFSLYKNQKEIINNFDIPCISLGDIFFSYNTIKYESIEQKKLFYEHFVHLLIHSYLHLLTFDHIKNNEQKRMEKIEIEILKKCGIFKNPYFI
jgi:probable rRNA maturation factor